MWSFAAQIPDGLIFGIVPVVLSLIFAWAAWVTLQTGRVNDHERRIGDLERREVRT